MDSDYFCLIGGKMINKIFAALSIVVMLSFLCTPVLYAQENQAQGSEIKAAPGSDNEFSMKKFIALACGIAIGIAAMGGAIGQGTVGASALLGLARNPSASDKLFLPFILGLVFIESLVIYALVISFILLFKL
jgi:F-type H+-transporting ATPase subunit c